MWGRYLRVDSEVHDQVFAARSHLPHLLSFALVRSRKCAGTQICSSFLPASGFAISHALRRVILKCGGILFANRSALFEELDGYRRELDDIREALVSSDGKVEEFFL